jgi:hypothetical protein
MRPEQIRELMQTMNLPKIVHVLPDERDDGDDLWRAHKVIT